MKGFINLSLLRKLAQAVSFIFLVYGGTVIGFYLADKLSIALPALSCAYDQKAADICTLVPLQHEMAHRVGTTLAAGGSIWMGLMPVLITLGTFLAIFVFLNKAFCGWVCPLGFFQEMMSLIGQKLGLRRVESLAAGTVDRIRPIKWAMLSVLIFGLPLLSGLGFVSHDFVGSYCNICPSRILTTLATGDTSQLHVDSSNTTLAVFSVIADFLFGGIIAVGLTVRQPFCRICPLLALHAVFRKLGLVRLVKNAKPRCNKCGLCAKACPMDIREIHTEMEKKDVVFADCTLCGRCVEFCPDKDVLQLKYAVFPVFRADPAYFKRRNKAQQRWEKANLLSWWRGRRRETQVQEG